MKSKSFVSLTSLYNISLSLVSTYLYPDLSKIYYIFILYFDLPICLYSCPSSSFRLFSYLSNCFLFSSHIPFHFIIYSLILEIDKDVDKADTGLKGAIKKVNDLIDSTRGNDLYPISLSPSCSYGYNHMLTLSFSLLFSSLLFSSITLFVFSHFVYMYIYIFYITDSTQWCIIITLILVLIGLAFLVYYL